MSASKVNKGVGVKKAKKHVDEDVLLLLKNVKKALLEVLFFFSSSATPGIPSSPTSVCTS